MSTPSVTNTDFKRAIASADPLIRLKHPSGLYLNIDGSGLTGRSDFGGCYSGRAHQVANMRRVNSLAAQCREVEA